VATVRLVAKKPGVLGIPLTRLIQREAGLTLGPAFKLMNRFWEGEVVTIDLPTVEAAERFLRAADEIGAVAELVPERLGTAADG
jgi:hypothetical protein